MRRVENHLTYRETFYSRDLYTFDNNDNPILSRKSNTQLSDEESENSISSGQLYYKLNVVPLFPVHVDNFNDDELCNVCYSNGYLTSHNHFSFKICIYCFRSRLRSKCPQCKQHRWNISYSGSKSRILIHDNLLYLMIGSKLSPGVIFDGSTSLKSLKDVVSKYSLYPGKFSIIINNIILSFEEISVRIKDYKTFRESLYPRFDSFDTRNPWPVLVGGCNLRMMRFYHKGFKRHLYINYFIEKINSLDYYCYMRLASDDDADNFKKGYCRTIDLDNNNPNIVLKSNLFWNFIEPSFLDNQTSLCGVVGEYSENFHKVLSVDSITIVQPHVINMDHLFLNRIPESNDYTYIKRTIRDNVPNVHDQNQIFLREDDYNDYFNFFNYYTRLCGINGNSITVDSLRYFSIF